MRRVTRRTPLVGGLGPLAASLAAQIQKAAKPPATIGTPRTIPIQDYTTRVTTTLVGGYSSAIVPASGTVTVKAGPQGIGTVWYPQSAAIATTTGALDNSTCSIYAGPLGLQTLISGQSFAGGASSVGLPVPPVWPGYFIVAVWTGATPGDLATLTVYGTQDALG